MFGLLRKPLTNYEATLALLKTASILDKANRLQYEYILRGIDKYCYDNKKKISQWLRGDIQLAATCLVTEEGIYYIKLFGKSKSLEDFDFCVGKVREIFERVGVLWQYPAPIERKVAEAISAQSEMSFERTVRRQKNISKEQTSCKKTRSEYKTEKTLTATVPPPHSADYDGFSVNPLTKLDDHPSKGCKGINRYLLLYLDGATVYSKASPSRALYEFRAWLEREYPDVYEEYSGCFQEHKLSQMRDLIVSYLNFPT